MQRKLWVVTSLVLVLGLMGVARLWAEETQAKAAIGQPAPAFALKDLNGKSVSLADYAGKIVVLEWVNPECPFVVRHYEAKTMTRLADKYKDKDVAWLAIATGKTADAELNKKFAEQHGVTHPVLLDSEATVGRAYGAKTTPHMFVIGRDGKLLYMGGIDDDAAGKKGDKAVNYVDKALGEITTGQSVSQPETKSYGCSVKY